MRTPGARISQPPPRPCCLHEDSLHRFRLRSGPGPADTPDHDRTHQPAPRRFRPARTPGRPAARTRAGPRRGAATPAPPRERPRLGRAAGAAAGPPPCRRLRAGGPPARDARRGRRYGGALLVCATLAAGRGGAGGGGGPHGARGRGPAARVGGGGLAAGGAGARRRGPAGGGGIGAACRGHPPRGARSRGGAHGPAGGDRRRGRPAATAGDQHGGAGAATARAVAGPHPRRAHRRRVAASVRQRVVLPAAPGVHAQRVARRGARAARHGTAVPVVAAGRGDDRGRDRRGLQSAAGRRGAALVVAVLSRPRRR